MHGCCNALSSTFKITVLLPSHCDFDGKKEDNEQKASASLPRLFGECFSIEIVLDKFLSVRADSAAEAPSPGAGRARDDGHDDLVLPMQVRDQHR